MIDMSDQSDLKKLISDLLQYWLKENDAYPFQSTVEKVMQIMLQPHKLLNKCTEHISPTAKGLSLFIASVIEDISSRHTRLIMIDIDTIAQNAAKFGLTHPHTVRSRQEVSNMLYELQVNN